MIYHDLPINSMVIFHSFFGKTFTRPANRWDGFQGRSKVWMVSWQLSHSQEGDGMMGWSGKTHGTLEEDGRMGCFGRPVGSGIQGCGQAVWPRKIDLNIPDARVGNLACNETLDFLNGFKTHSFYDVLHEFPHCFHLFPLVFPSFLPSLPWISPWFAIVFSHGKLPSLFF